jgi:hypothetical protein
MIVIALLASSLSVTAQLKRKTHNTDFTQDQFYTVQNIKHGQFIRTGSGFFYRHILIFGSYRQDRRSEDWYFFYRDHFNSIMSRGSFVRDKKVGSWFEYYPLDPIDSLTNISQFRGMTAKTALFANPVATSTQTLAYDTTGQKLMSSGVFLEDEKIGLWDYYERNGKLLQQYDHSLKKLIVNHAVDSVQTGINFLGGGNRFFSLFYGEFALSEAHHFGQKSTIIYKISNSRDTITWERIRTTGFTGFAEYCDKIVMPLKSDWIIVHPEVHTEIYLLIDYLYQFRRGRFLTARFVNEEP